MKRLALTCAALLCAAAGPALAAPQWSVGEPGVLHAERLHAAPHAAATRYAQSRGISPAEAKRIALSATRGGEVVDIRRRGDVYHVRVIRRDGVRVDIKVDARTGRVR